MSSARASAPPWRHPLFRPLAALALLLAVAALSVPGFLHLEIKDGRLYGNLVDILHRAAPLMLAALGMTLVIATRGIDVSVGRYSMYDRVEYNPPRTIWSVSREAKGAFGNWPRELAKGDTREEAIAAFKKRAAELLAEERSPTKGATFEIYGKRADAVGARRRRPRARLPGTLPRTE